VIDHDHGRRTCEAGQSFSDAVFEVIAREGPINNGITTKRSLPFSARLTIADSKTSAGRPSILSAGTLFE